MAGQQTVAGASLGQGHRPSARAGRRPEVLEELATFLRHRHVGDARESLSTAIMLAELERLVSPLDAAADLTHLTVSAIVAGRRGVVLHRHRRLHRWLQPGGHIEPGERPERAVIRECLEETGLRVVHPAGGAEVVHVDVHRAPRSHLHLDLRFLVWAPERDPSPAPGESPDAAWFGWDDAERLADDALAGALLTARRLVDSRWHCTEGPGAPIEPLPVGRGCDGMTAKGCGRDDGAGRPSGREPIETDD